MRYVLKLESIADYAAKSAARRWVRGSNVNKRDLFLIRNDSKLRPWVAQISGLDAKYGFARDFITPQRDYSKAEGVGNRGVFLYYWLEPGAYEVNERVSVKCARRYYLIITDSCSSIESTKEEVMEWLRVNVR